MVSVYTIDGEVTLDVTQFQVATQKMKEEFSKLHTTLTSFTQKTNNEMFWNRALVNTKELNEEIIWLKQNVADVGNAFNNTQGINTLKSEVKSLREELNALKEQVNQIGATATEQATKVGNTVQNTVNKVKESISTLQTTSHPFASMGQMEKETIRMNNGVREVNSQMDQLTGKMERVTTFSKDIANYFMNENKWLQQNVALIEKEATATQKRVTALQRVGREYVNLNSQMKRGLTFEEEMVATEQLFRNTIGEEIAEKFKLNAEIQKSNELYMQNLELEKASANLEKEMITFLTEENGLIQRITGSHEKSMMAIKEELAFEKNKVETIAEENALLNEQTGIREKNASVNKLDQFGNLPRRIGSMALTMWGFNEIMDIYETTSANLNARGSMKYFGDQLMKDERYLKQTNQTVGDVRRGLRGFGDDLDDLQKKYQKIDMTVIGANAEETAYKYGVSTDAFGDLAEAYAIYGSEFVKQGRTQEDSVLAINDALDGEVRRLKEVNIGMDDLKEHGYDGTTESMIKALNEIAKERGYDVTAQNITNLSDAITVLELKLSQDLASAFEKIEPLLREVAKDFVTILETFEWAFGGINDLWNRFTLWADIEFGVQNMQKFGKSFLNFLGWFVTFAITLGIVYKVVSKLRGLFGSMGSILGKGEDVAKTTGDVGKTMNTGGFKENFKSEWGKLGKNLGKMARVFLELAIAMVMAFALIEEAMFLISGIGATYDALKPQFESGIEFIKEYGIWILAIGGAMSVALYFLSKVEIGENAYGQMAKSALLVAEGLALAMGLIAEAILLLNAPLLAIASIGWVRETFDSQITDGFETIKMMGDLLSQITLPVALFIGGLLVASVILGYAPALAIGLGIGIALTIGLVAEAILALNLPLMTIASLGWMSSTLGQGNIEQGCEVIKQVGEVLQVLAEAIPSLLVVDVAMLGHSLMTLATRFLNGGRDGLTQFTEEVIPNLKQFVDNLNATALPSEVDQDVIDSITNLAVQIPPLFNAVSKVNQALGTADGVGNIFGAIGGGISGWIGMGLKSKLDQLYNDCVDIMDFATKMGGLSSSGAKINSAIVQVASAIVSLKAKLDLMATTISTSSDKIRTSATNLGKAIIDGWKTGSSNFGATVVTTLTNGVQAVQNRYNTMKSGGQALGNKLVEGWNAHSPKLKTTIANEIYYALKELDDAKSKFYKRGQALGSELHRGFESEGGLNVGSPAKIARTIAQEMEYSAMALEKGKQMMYSGGVALGQALATGYGAYGGIKTDISTLARNGLNTDELTQGAKKLAPNTKTGNKEINMPIINIDMSNSTIIGIDDFETRIRESVDKAMVTWHSEDGALGY